VIKALIALILVILLIVVGVVVLVVVDSRERPEDDTGALVVRG